MPIVLACMSMSKKKVGALIIIERHIGLSEYINSGDQIDANITQRLIENIFFKNSPLHDGAMIIRDREIVAAACFLPLADDISVARELGTRHRAALGISMVTDSITIVVSEETGIISIARDGKLIRYIDKKALLNLLESVFQKEHETAIMNLFKRRAKDA